MVRRIANSQWHNPVIVLNITYKLPQTATIWPSTPDGYGGFTFGTPILAKCRWEDKSELFMNRLNGKEEVSRAQIFVDQDAEVGDWIALNDNTATANPSILPDAFPIRSFESTPDIRNLVRVRKAVI